MITETDFLTVPGMKGLGTTYSFRDGLVALIEAVRQQKIWFKKHKASDWARSYVSLEGPSFINAVISVDLTDYPRADVKYELRDKKVEYSDINNGGRPFHTAQFYRWPNCWDWKM